MKSILLASLLAACPAMAFPLGSPLHSLQVATAQRELSDNAARAGDCYVLAVPDSRTYCLARVHRDSGRCYAIQRADLRAMCLAEVRR